MTKQWLAGLLMVAVGTLFTPIEADAKRLGGGGSSGMQRAAPQRATPTNPPAKPATPTAAPAKNSWMGPIAGLAAGLGIAALMSHLGMGEAFGNALMIGLLVLAAVFVVRWFMRRANAGQQTAPAGMQFAGAGTGGQAVPGMTGSGFGSSAPAAEPLAVDQATSVPAGFDSAGFERIAKMIFIRLQAANDANDLDDLRKFTTPEMYAAIKLDLQDRGTVTQATDVVRVDAEVIDVAREGAQQIVSVRFHGLIREERDAPASDFDETWHLVKPASDSNAWVIAGIQQRN